MKEEKRVSVYEDIIPQNLTIVMTSEKNTWKIIHLINKIMTKRKRRKIMDRHIS